MEFESVGWREGGVDGRVDTRLLRRHFFVSCLFFDDCGGGAIVCETARTGESKASKAETCKQKLEM
jgi:hypothetical protein